MLKTRVKASQITNLTDARYFAAWEVEWLGFNFDKGSENYIQPQVMKAIKEWVEGPKLVGEFSFASAEDIRIAKEMLELDMVQVGMFVEEETLKALKGVPIIKEIVFHNEMTLADLENHFQQFDSYVEFFLLNFDKNGITWEMIKKGQLEITQNDLVNIFQQHKTVLSIDLSESAISEILLLENLTGINVVGGEEEKVGVKSFDELDEIFETLEVLI